MTERPRHACMRRGFTLVELVASMMVMTLLLGAMTSTMMLASRALRDGTTPLERRAAAAAVLSQIEGELTYATSIGIAEADEITFTVADRGHGATGPEKIRYAWSGTAGDPLMRQYNDGTEVALCDQLHAFSLAYLFASGPRRTAPRVLLVVDDAVSPDYDETTRQLRMESWGFTVELISDHDSPAAFDVAAAANDVMYVSETVLSGDFSGKDPNPAIGLVTEERRIYNHLGISYDDHADFVDDEIWISDSTHEITSGFGDGRIRIYNVPDNITYCRGSLAPGARVLGQWPGYDPSMVVIEAGGELYGGGTARGRRVKLPWADTGFGIDDLAETGWTIMKRAIQWASAVRVYRSVQIQVQATADGQTGVEANVNLLNQPGAG